MYKNLVKHQGKPRPAIGGCRVSNWQPQSLQLTTVEPAIGKRSYICRFTTLYIYQNHKNNKE